ncbi:truncated ER mannose-binding lectin [Culex quinquefasciatus]|uniref:Truncated ER mannose-binding lectin n=1 Tax=Culex quinquefasciatus TaxID=7176 RepID=B0W303_CULQU|nr:truncated ER mannose-binding lectin [Culex quinquefasciatus]|eukprot:XP_001843087.1 truncated ER mannose-binding lectin [Culex quinquefasciatus]
MYYNILPVLFYYGMANSDQEYEMRFRAEIVVLPKNGHFALSAATGVTEEQTKLGLENWFDEYNARELRQIWEAKTATYNQLRTMSSKLDDMQNLLNKMRDGMNQVKQGVASVKQRFGFQDATVAIASQCAMPELTAFLMTIVMHLLVIVAYNMYSLSVRAKDDCVQCFAKRYTIVVVRRQPARDKKYSISSRRIRN